jgi:hypothetical protein
MVELPLRSLIRLYGVVFTLLYRYCFVNKRGEVLKKAAVGAVTSWK